MKKATMINLGFSSIILAVSTLVLSSCSESAWSADMIVATGKGIDVKQSQLNQYVAVKLFWKALEGLDLRSKLSSDGDSAYRADYYVSQLGNLIECDLTMNRATVSEKSTAKTAADARIDKLQTEMKESREVMELFESFRKTHGLTINKLRAVQYLEQVFEEMQERELMPKVLQVATDYYNHNRDKFPDKPEVYRCNFILISTHPDCHNQCYKERELLDSKPDCGEEKIHISLSKRGLEEWLGRKPTALEEKENEEDEINYQNEKKDSENLIAEKRSLASLVQRKAASGDDFEALVRSYSDDDMKDQPHGSAIELTEDPTDSLSRRFDIKGEARCLNEYTIAEAAFSMTDQPYNRDSDDQSARASITRKFSSTRRVSSVFEDGFQWKKEFYIVKLNEIVPSRRTSFSEVKDQIVSSIRQKVLNDEKAGYGERLRADAEVKVLTDFSK